MKKILGIIGSPRQAGNCEIMVREISRKLKTPHQLTLLRLTDFELCYCNACYRCLAPDKNCVIQDDLESILDAIADADALILAVPTYFLSSHAALKVLLDRGLSFYNRADELWGKPSVGVGLAGITGKEGSTLLDIERFFAVLFAENKHSRILYGALPGEVMLEGEGGKAAAELAAALFAPALEKSQPSCPLCGGETFRFMGGDQVRCMLCSETGTLDYQNNTFQINLEPGAHPVLLNPTKALEHRQWLCGMVDRFKKERSRLKEAQQICGEDVLWVLPNSKDTCN